MRQPRADFGILIPLPKSGGVNIFSAVPDRRHWRRFRERYARLPSVEKSAFGLASKEVVMLSRWNDFGVLNRLAARESASPFEALDDLRREMNRLFFDFERSSAPEQGSGAWPRVSLQDTGPALLVRAEVPGLDPEQLEVNVDESTLTLKGAREDRVPDGYSVHRKERHAYTFTRAFSLPSKVDAEQVKAEIKHGILTITLPKAKSAQPRQISVSSS